MRILFLTTSLAVSDGWGRYSLGFIAEAHQRFGGDAAIVPEPSSLRSTADTLRKPYLLFKDARSLLETAKKSDLIHVLTEPLAPLGCTLGLLAHRPVVISTHGTYGDAGAYPWYLRPMYWFAFRRAVAVVAVSRYTAGVVRRTFGRRKIEIVPGGFDLVPYVNDRVLGSPPFRLLSVGALKRRKGFHTLIEALAVLKRQGFPVKSRIIGSRQDQAYVRQLEKAVVEHGLRDTVEFQSDVPDDELNRAYAEADLFVLPSEHRGVAFEGLGLVYLEALSHGTPVIGSLDSGATDVIADGINGYLVPPGNPEALVAAIRKALADPESWHRLTVQSSESIELFAWDRVGGRMAKIYDSVLKSNTHRL
jgi:phosphatidylinositol alpha-mannosyltransferase